MTGLEFPTAIAVNHGTVFHPKHEKCNSGSFAYGSG
jgi:hypothetical protein